HGAHGAHGAPGAWTAVPTANPKAPGLTTPNKLSPELADVARAQGATPLENPRDGVGYYGYDSVDDRPALVTGDATAAHKSEPDKNTYLVLRGQKGPDAGYDYGTHFLFQGHESGKPGYVTRVNLDADAAHRVTLLVTKDSAGKDLPAFDGSSWDPFAKKLLFTSESACTVTGGTATGGGVWAGDPGYSHDATLDDVSGALGRGGYEGVQTASDGSIWLVEDIGGAKIGDNKAGKDANSYVYRFVPASKGDLSKGKLQALQVDGTDGKPMTTKGDPFGQDLKDLHTYGKSFTTRWVTVHDTATDGDRPFCATQAAAAQDATAFKRPENGQFRPGTGFREFYFTETGDTSSDSPANDGYGGWGGVMRLRQSSPSADTGTLSPAYLGDEAHTGLDNLSFASRDELLVVEDAGDGLHSQRGALDSGFVLDVSKARPEPTRFLAEGRDPSATLDSALSGAPGFTNDGDNEITGIHVSDGDPTVQGLIGSHAPHLFHGGWRAFWTQQHGDNTTFELVPSGSR
ncbi:MAG: alkaline phosphatase PhoX, partial [Nocardioidaceae bacterium]